MIPGWGDSETETPKATGYLREACLCVCACVRGVGGSCLKDRHVHSHQDTDMSKMLPVSRLSPSSQSSPLADEKNRAER